MTDPRSGRRSFALVEQGRLVFALYTAPDPVPVARQWAASLLTATDLGARTVLAGRPGADLPDGGAIVCSCLAVGANTIAAAIRGGCTSVDAVGSATGAGTNCGSCRAEIRGIISASLEVAVT